MAMDTKTKILVVDDEEDVRLTLEDLLTEHKFRVILATNAKEALSVLKRKKIDIVISDLVMPGMNGIALTKEIIDMRPQMPVIVMTAYASIEHAVESMKAGAFDFIPKPFKLNHTLFVIEKALETKRLQEMAQKSNYYRELSNIDELTGIHNHRFFKQTLRSETDRHMRYGRRLSLLMIDIDNFKSVNDQFGHLAGDQVLHGVAQIMKKTIRGCDLIARYGGEEFTAILPETSEAEAIMVAKRILTTINTHSPQALKDKNHEQITVTIGLASFPNDATTAIQLVQKADIALYHGKQTGKNKLCIFRKIEAKADTVLK